MSSVEQNPFTNDSLALPFIEASFVAHETKGDPKIPVVIVREISASLGMNEKMAAAYAFIARVFVDGTLEEIDTGF